jgi:hypothetical protein
MIETLIFLVVSVVLTELLRPKPKFENARPAGLGDFNFPTATEGRPVPLIWGRVKAAGPNVVWYGDLQVDAIREKVKTGLWSSTRIIKGFRYYIGVQMALCRGPGVILRRIWVGEDAVWSGTQSVEGSLHLDVPDLFGGDDYGNGGIQTSVDFYVGSTSQTVSPYLDTTARQRIGTAATPTAPRYSGTCYVVTRELTNAGPAAGDRGAYFGNGTTIAPWAFELERYPNLFSGQSAGENKVGSDDANPVNVVYELLTNTEWGFGFAASEVDVGPGSSFLDAADQMITEQNGFSMLLDNTIDANQMLEELQRQMEALVFLDHRTGKWRIKLVRDDYDINTALLIDESNIKEIRDYTKGAWEDTTNQIQVQFTKRDDEYKESYALAQDTANAVIMSGGSLTSPQAVSAVAKYPGVKRSDLANYIAWRDIRTQSYPLARAQFVLNRQSWSTRVGDVVAWSNTRYGFVRLPMRVLRADYGKPDDNQLILQCVQDVFRFAAASGGAPSATQWNEPTVALVAYPSAAQLAFEAPRALIVRDPDYTGDPYVAKVFAAARRQGSELAFNIGQRNSSGALSGAPSDAGDVMQFMLVGKLTSAISAGTAIPTSTITISPDPDSQTRLEALFEDTTTIQDMGTDLVQLILVGSEFMLVTSAANSGANVNLQNVYRGALDSAQANHAINAPVYILFAGGGLTDTTFPTTNNVGIELRAQSTQATFPGAVTEIALLMDKRALRPYPPNASLYNGSSTAFGAINADADGSGLNGLGFNVSWRRRDFETTNEVSELLADNTAVDASTEYRVRVFVAPDGANTEVHTGSWATGTGPEFINRLLLWNEAAAGTEIRVQIEVRHDIQAETNLVGRQYLIHDVVPTSSYDARFYFGGDLRANDVSNAYTAVATGTFTLRLGAAYSTSNVQARLNVGAWVTIVAAGATSATFAVTSGDTVEVRHTTNETPSPQLVQLENPSTNIVAYGVLSD